MQHRLHTGFAGSHLAQHGGLAFLGAAQQVARFVLQLAVAHFVNFTGPFLEQVLRDFIDSLDTFGNFLGAALCAVQFAVELVVGLFEIAARKIGDGLKRLQRALELVRRLALGLLGILDAADQDVAFFFAQLFIEA